MKQLHPKAVWLFFIKYLIFATLALFFFGQLFFAAFSLFATLKPGVLWEQNNPLIVFSIWVGSFLVVAPLIAYFFAKLSYRFYRYELLEEGFRKESGIIWKHYTTIPYDRIQNVDIYRGILDRILELSDLHIQTAGSSGYGRSGGGAEGKLPGIDPKIAEQLRDDLIHRARGTKNQGL